MREDMQYISGVLDELEAIVQDASGVPMRKGRAVVDRSDLLVMLDELRASLPRELAEAEALRRECGAMVAAAEEEGRRDRKSTRLNSSHANISYAVFCLKKKNTPESTFSFPIPSRPLLP